MPVDSMLFAASVVVMFVAFAAVLMQGDLQTRPKQLAQQSSARRRPF
jgi:hypothetical protein